MKAINRIDELDNMISELDAIDTSVPEEKEEDETDMVFMIRINSRKEEIVDEIQGVSYNGE